MIMSDPLINTSAVLFLFGHPLCPRYMRRSSPQTFYLNTGAFVQGNSTAQLGAISKMEITLPIRSQKPPLPPPRTLLSIVVGLLKIFARFPYQALGWTESIDNGPGLRHDERCFPLLLNVRRILLHAKAPLPPAVAKEMRESLLAMEAEAEALGRQTEEHQRRWAGVLKQWERECERYCEPPRDPAEMDVTGRIARLELQ